MTKEEYYSMDPQSGESEASLREEWLEADRKYADKIRTDIARTLEGIDTMSRNRYLDSYMLNPISDILHAVESKLMFLESQHDPNRMESYEEKYLKTHDLFSEQELHDVRDMIDDDEKYIKFLKHLIKDETI